MRRLLLSRLENFRLEKPGRWKLEVMPGVSISNNNGEVLRRVSNKAGKLIGTGELHHLLTSDVLLVGEFDDFKPEMNPIDFIIAVFHMMNGVFRSMWLVKDNAVRLGVTHLIDSGEFGLRVSNTFPTDQYLAISGGRQVTSYSEPEWEKVIQFYNQTERYLGSGKLAALLTRCFWECPATYDRGSEMSEATGL